MGLKSILLILAWLVSSQRALALDAFQLRKADKISIALTGSPLSASLRKKFVSGEVTLTDLADQLSKSPQFIERYAQFWTNTLGFQSQVDVLHLKVNGTNTLLNQIDGSPFVFRNRPETWVALTLEFLTKKNGQDADYRGIVTLEIKQCVDGPLIVGSRTAGIPAAQFRQIAKTGISGDGKPILPGTQAEWQRAADFYSKITPECTEDLPRINPWWDPKEVTYSGRYAGMKTYKVAPYIQFLCGDTLEKCNLSAQIQFDTATDAVATDMTMESGYIIAHTVAEDRPFAEILTTPTTIMTGRYGEFMVHNGKALWANFPLKSYNDSAHPIFTKPDVTDKKHYRIDRNNLHAGVLTTPGFQTITNGRRAKANRAYETFLCKKFAVPEGANPDPNDSNPDLTKRTYCTYCHKSLEPMATFFNRWPDTGAINYLYNSAETIKDGGRFDGKTGNGAAALGKILSEAESFPSCSVTRAFEFVNGRKMDRTEADNLIPDLVSRFNSSQQNLRSIIKELVLSPDFLDARGK